MSSFTEQKTGRRVQQARCARVLARAVGLALMLSCAACVPYERAALDEDARFELFYQRRLSDFEQRLSAERQVGLDDAWTRVGEAWIALSSCEPIDEAAAKEAPLAQDKLAMLLWTTLRLEQTRRARYVHHKGTGFRALSVTGTIHATLDDADFFERKAKRYADHMIVWPHGDEAWADELPAAKAMPSSCDKFYRTLFMEGRAERAVWDAQEATWAKLRGRDPAQLPSLPPPRTLLNVTPAQADAKAKVNARPKPKTLAYWQRLELELAQRVLDLGKAIDAEHRVTAPVDAMLWRVRYHQGMLLSELGMQLEALERPSVTELEYRAAWYTQSREALAPLAQRELIRDSAPVEASWRALTLLIYADWQTAQQHLEPALASFALAEELGYDAANRELGRYLHVRALSRVGRWDDVVAFADRMPAISSKYYPAMSYRIAYAMRRLGQTDAFMGLALKAFRDRPFQADPFLRALYVQILEVITEYPFEARTTELIEDLGPRGLIYERVEAYATVALDRGKPENARAAAVWLLAKHSNANFYPRYHALLALSSFLEDKPELFVQHLAEITKRPAQVVEAVGERRQATFFAGADAQLAKVFRQMLPAMAEWGDGPQAKAARQRWLKLMMEQTQRFVRAVPSSLARPELIELYRLASAMLEQDDPRAYPERVGATEPAPLVLGTVRVEDRDLAPYEPSGSFEGMMMSSLTLLPRDREPLTRWQPFWSPATPDAPKDAGAKTTAQVKP